MALMQNIRRGPDELGVAARAPGASRPRSPNCPHDLNAKRDGNSVPRVRVRLNATKAGGSNYQTR